MASFYHFTSLTIGAWRPEERFSTRRIEHSLYWQKVFSELAYQSELEGALERFPALNQIDQPQAAHLAQAVASGRYLYGCMKELIFESVRVTVDPRLPSRSNCLFLIDARADLERYAQQLGWAEEGRSLLELEPTGRHRLLRARPSLLDTSILAHDLARAAEEYWRGAPKDAPPNEVEVLFSGSFRIRRVIKQGDAPGLTFGGKTFANLFRT